MPAPTNSRGQLWGEQRVYNDNVNRFGPGCRQRFRASNQRTSRRGNIVDQQNGAACEQFGIGKPNFHRTIAEAYLLRDRASHAQPLRKVVHPRAGLGIRTRDDRPRVESGGCATTLRLPV